MTISAKIFEAAGAPPELAERIAGIIAGEGDAPSKWRILSNDILSSGIPFSVHRATFQAVYAKWDDTQGPPPAWVPTPADIENSNIHAFAARAGVSVPQLHHWSAANRADFWQCAIDTIGVRFKARPTATIADATEAEAPHWFPGARLNATDSCFSADPNETAIVFQAEGGFIQRLSFGELNKLSNRVANSVLALGIRPGDAIAVAMPMTVEAVAAYIGIIKAGCVVVSIADSFAAEEIATRLRISQAVAVVTQDIVFRAGKTLPMYDKTVAAGAKRCIVVPAATGPMKLREGDVSWGVFLVEDDSFDSVGRLSDDVTNILFSSGTTGDPKAIPWTQTTPIKCAVDGYLHHDIQPGDIVAWPTNLGWMMGPWLIYASLMNRATIALYYGAPNTREFCQFVRDARVTMLGVVPSLVKAWRAADAVRNIDWSCIKLFSSTGESSNAEDYLYLMSLAGYRPVIEYCGGTEIGGGYVAGTIVQAASPSTFSTPAFGLDFVILDEDELPADEGEIFLVPPSVGLSQRLLNKDHHEVYFAGTPAGVGGVPLRRHGDRLHRIGGGYFRAEGRADDTMNLGGIKVSSAEIERTLAATAGVVETAAIAVSPPGGGPSQLVIYVVSEADANLDAKATAQTMQAAVSKTLNPLFRIHDVVIVEGLPRTASNKVMRRVLRDQYRRDTK